MKQFNVAVGTPYLYATLDEWQAHAEKKGYNELFIQDQQNDFGYRPDKTLADVADHAVGDFNVRVVSLEKPEGEALDLLTYPQKVGLAIFGNTQTQEEKAFYCGARGMIVGRYSIFYGEVSKYSGNKPEDSGYALDFPKDPELLQEFIATDYILGALQTKKGEAIKGAVELFNKGRDKPVLTTPWLDLPMLK